MLNACVDVFYDDKTGIARTGVVLFPSWESSEISASVVTSSQVTEPYIPGQFYLREAPCILAGLRLIPEGLSVDCLVVDGYVDLGPNRPGLGHHLYNLLNEAGVPIPIIGVAKHRFKDAGGIEVYRGDSQKPLIVTSIGVPVLEAANRISQMHGTHRIPTLLKRVDQLSRGLP